MKSATKEFQLEPVPYLGQYIHGEFRRPQEIVKELDLISPADRSDVISRIQYSFVDIEEAVSSARQAFSKWRKTSFEERAGYLKKYAENLKKIQKSLAVVMAREVGKPLWESESEVATMIQKVEVTIQEGRRPVMDYSIAGVAPGTDARCEYRPQGVFAVVGPFNFPGHLPNGQIVPALLLGNCVIFKPADQAPLTGQMMAQAMDSAGIPAGVFQLIQGYGEIGRRLSIHDGIDGILFTGSFDVGQKIKQDTVNQYWKVLALEMGGKNSAIIFDDAKFDQALSEVFVSSFITAGQRCSASSRILVHETLLERFVDQFHKRAKKFTIGHPLTQPFMGPLISDQAVEKYLKFVGIAEREGCEVIMRGKKLDYDFEGSYVAPSVCLVKDQSLEAVQRSVYQQSEIFGPNVALYTFKNDEEALQLANATDFGLVCSLFTQSEERYRRVQSDLDFGLVNWNRSTVGASARLPFGGIKKSGNHAPAGLFMSASCAYPVASLEVKQPQPAVAETLNKQYMGLNWEE